MNMSDAIIETFELRKSFGTVQAVNGLNLTVPRGSICGFMGRNGAGKTTTMKMLLGMLKPCSGAGTVLVERGASVTCTTLDGFCRPIATVVGDPNQGSAGKGGLDASPLCGGRVRSQLLLQPGTLLRCGP